MVHFLDCIQAIFWSHLWIYRVLIAVLTKRDFRSLLNGIRCLHLEDGLVKSLKFRLKPDSLVEVLLVFILFFDITDEVLGFNLLISAPIDVLPSDECWYLILQLLLLSFRQGILLDFLSQLLFSLIQRVGVFPFIIDGLTIPIDLQVMRLE